MHFSCVLSHILEFLEIPTVEEQESLDVLDEAQKQVKQYIAQAVATYQRTLAESEALRKEIAILEQQQERPFSGVPFKTHSAKSKGGN